MNGLPSIPVVLASSSPRRRALLTLIGIEHHVRPANIDESYFAGERPPDHAERLARAKVDAVASDDTLTIGSDTIVVVDGDVLGKPGDEADAGRMLRRLSGRSHTVVTAIAIAWQGQRVSAVESAEVRFRELSTHEIGRYIATGEPMDKAGAYGIQGFGATIVEQIQGDYFTVMGLPLNRLVLLLRDVGVRYDFGPLRLID